MTLILNIYISHQAAKKLEPKLYECSNSGCASTCYGNDNDADEWFKCEKCPTATKKYFCPKCEQTCNTHEKICKAKQQKK